MSTIRLTISTLALAVAAGWTQHAIAQESPTPQPPAAATEEITELPGLVVEAPAKRNIKKEKLRRSAPQGGSQPAALEQQVVEGEKVVRTIRDTQTSVAVVTGQDISERQIRDLDEAIGQAANVVTTQDPNAGFAVRGLNAEGLTGLQHISGVPAIGVVVDGVTQNPDAVRRGARGLWDTEQVEVLRGPQSTLQGRNAIGGTVIVKTNDPTYKLGGVVEGTIGTNDLYGAGFVLNAPIVAGQSAFRISGYKTERDRGIDYADPENKDMGIDAYDTLRGKLLIEPDSLPGFSALFTASRTHDAPGSGIVSGPNFLDRELNYTSSFTDFREGTVENYAADLSYELSRGLTLRSVTGYADTISEIYTAAGAELIRNGDNVSGSDFTQDLRLEIDNQGNGLSGVLGLFYGKFERSAFNDTSLHIPFLEGIPDVAALLGGASLPDITLPYQNGTAGMETTTIAAYADLRYRWDRWVFNAGGRLLRDEIKSNENGVGMNAFNWLYDYFGFPYLGDVYSTTNTNSNATFNEFLPKAGISYDLTDNQTIGVSYNKGYRTGFQQWIALPPPVGGFRSSTVSPEYLNAYELSYRSNWLNKTLEFNSNFFYYDYKDQQVTVLDNVYRVSEILNAGSSHAYGAEFEARWRPIPPLQLFASLGLLQTKFDDFVRGPGQDFSGNEYPDAPGYTFAAGALYKSAEGWFVGANVRHIDGYQSTGDVDNSPTQYVDSYTVVDARAGWEWENYTLTVFAKNLFDEKYLTAVERNDSPPLSPGYGMIGDERQFGLTLRAEY
ncbi:TonB-dependent receptor [Hyphomicrobium sp. LHD-15]|uniref:TonB-dependent receptor n=1 Tax=Hyphomicrobium sp. LHD-15 TaxID=3072142 RepID=UPI0028101BA2|nr:TonB-dependent receptor [Hyphomicrobium sp. LHD-15]MDQ8697779.1 TonB-dependent receptor [Hyphomicrobium sp. LHD-15]